MTYLTERGEFDSLQELRAAYLKSKDGGEYWRDPTPFGQDVHEPGVLHASDVGACPRAAMYRLSGAPEKPRSKKSAANREIMFWAGYRLHYLTYSALDWAGLLMTYERPVPMPDGWAGAYDAVFFRNIEKPELTLYDMKTVMPNLLKGWLRTTLPKPHNVTQISVYDLHLKEVLPAINGALIEYADRAGANDPCECIVDVTMHDHLGVRAGMAMLESCRASLPDLPPTLPCEYSPSYWKLRGQPSYYLKELTYKLPWECSYCDYHLTQAVTKTWSRTCADSLCKPHNPEPVVVAKFGTNGHMIECAAGHEEGVEHFLETHLKTVPIVEEEDEDA